MFTNATPYPPTSRVIASEAKQSLSFPPHPLWVQILPLGLYRPPPLAKEGDEKERGAG
jgi:hypothetical protein